MGLDDIVITFLGCISIGILIYIALCINELIELFREQIKKGE